MKKTSRVESRSNPGCSRCCGKIEGRKRERRKREGRKRIGNAEILNGFLAFKITIERSWNRFVSLVTMDLKIAKSQKQKGEKSRRKKERKKEKNGRDEGLERANTILRVRSRRKREIKGAGGNEVILDAASEKEEENGKVTEKK